MATKTRLTKTLYVGLGGTGVNTLLKVKKCFIDSYGVIPPMIGFLAIDTDGGAMTKAVTGSDGRAIRLAASELLVCTVPNALGVYRTNQREYDWVPEQNVAMLSSIQGGGAGQVRSNGRFIACFNSQRVSAAIASAFAGVSQLIPQDSPFEVSMNTDGMQYATDVHIIGSVAGGTGSGMLVDVLLMLRKTLAAQSTPYHIYPWIVLPEVFRSMNQGPSMANVLYNAAGALRTLDYIQHHEPNNPAIDFGYAKIDQQLFEYAYVINNTNEAGTTFGDIEDITDVVAKCAFLPANNMGSELVTPFDNIRSQQTAGTYDILNKKAWAAATGSAELIYDAQAVGRASALAIIQRLCASMSQATTDGLDEANAFFDDKDVMIRENNGRDDIINTLLTPLPSYSLSIDEGTSIADIEGYIADVASTAKLDNAIKVNLDMKLANTKTQFRKHLHHIMSRDEGRIGTAIAFIKSLRKIIAACDKEMVDEESEYKRINAVPCQWEAYVKALRPGGLMGWLKSLDQDAADTLASRLGDVTRCLREEIRRSWAQKFYASLDAFLNEQQQSLEGVAATLGAIGDQCTRNLVAEQQQAQTRSKFQIFLHTDDVMAASRIVLDAPMRSTFTQYLADKDGVGTWVGQKQESIRQSLFDFAKTTELVKTAVNTDIDQVLRRLPQEKVAGYMKRLKELASPLWTVNTQGFQARAGALDRFVIVGVDNRDTHVLAQDKRYNTYFNTHGNTTNFASTSQRDRVFVLVVADLLPIYAINNFSTYQREAELRQASGARMANYLDRKLNSRMLSEKFPLLPVVETDNVMQYWVWGFVFGLIHNDPVDGQYWVRSKKKGDALKKYRFNIGTQRDVAYDIFRSEAIYKEVEAELGRRIADDGRSAFEAKIKEVKDNDDYATTYAQLSPRERENIEDPKYADVKRLLAEEIGMMSN